MKTFLIAVFFLLATIPAQAANWILAAEENGSQWYVETESIRRIGNTIECWVKVNHAEDQYILLEDYVEQKKTVEKKRYRSKIEFNRYNCLNRTCLTPQVMLYSEIDRGGIVVWSYDFDYTGKPSRIVPETIDELLMKFVCQRSRQK